jgi:hypothetical protein
MKGNSCAGGLREALTVHDFEGTLKVLASVGALPPPNANSEYAKTIRMPGVKPSRLYEINPEKLEHARSRGGFRNVCNVRRFIIFDVTPLSVGNA